MPKLPDPEMLEFMASLEQGLQEARRGEGRVHTPDQIKARRAVGRPVQATHKQAITLRLDPDTLAKMRATGKGWQTRINAALRQFIQEHPLAP